MGIVTNLSIPITHFYLNILIIFLINQSVMLLSFLAKVSRCALGTCIDIQETVMKMYFKMFNDSIVSVKAYSDDRVYILYHVFFSVLYPIRTYKCNDIIYSDHVTIEVVHNKDNKMVTTVIPSKEIISLSSFQFQKNILGIENKKSNVLSFCLNQEPLIHIFNQICHSFHSYNVKANDFALYIMNKYKLECNPPYSFELIDDDFNEQTFKENDTIKINKFHEQ